VSGRSPFARVAAVLAPHALPKPPVLFYLGTHRPGWLADPRFRCVPLFVSRASLAGMRRMPRALTRWAADSGGFTELHLHGRWTLTPAAYVAELHRFRDEIGRLAWAAPMDWMCEPEILAKTGKTVDQHQRRTVDNLLALRALAPDLPIIPVLQSWSVVDYWRCQELYDKAGVDLAAEPVVGVGTVCRRQNTMQAGLILRTLARDGLRLHGFGFKTHGLLGCADVLASADSLAWSFAARREPPLPGHEEPGPGRRTGHQHCNNCPEFALAWREALLARLRVAARQAPAHPARPGRSPYATVAEVLARPALPRAA
jgi:hypothetical protein